MVLRYRCGQGRKGMRRLLLTLLLATPLFGREMPYQHTGTLAPTNCDLPNLLVIRATVQGRWLYLEAHNTTPDTWNLDWNNSTLSGKNAQAGRTVRTLTGTATYPDNFTSRLTWTGLTWPPKEKVQGGLFKYSEAGSIEARTQRAHLISVDPEPLYPGTTRTRAVAADLMAFAGWIAWPINDGERITLTLTLINPRGATVTCTLSAPLENGGAWPAGMKDFQTYFPDIEAPKQAMKEPATAGIKITTTPVDAEVSVDGNFVGTTPATLNLSPGTHTIELRKQGFTTWKRDLLVQADTPATINLTLEPTASARESSTTISGRLFDGVKDSPLPGAHVFVLATDRKTIIAHTITGKERGPLMGTLALRDLPSSGEVVLVGFHEAVKDNLWLLRFTLNGQANDLKIVSTTMAMHTVFAGGNGVGGLLELAGWVTHETLATRVSDATIELTDTLLKQLRTNR